MSALKRSFSLKSDRIDSRFQFQSLMRSLFLFFLSLSFRYLAMVFSNPILRDSISRQPEFDNLNDYLDRVNSVLLSRSSRSNRHYHCSSSALARLRNTLIALEVDLIKRSAISEGVWSFFPTPQSVRNRMLALAELRPHHCVLEPTCGQVLCAGCGDLATAIAQLDISKVDCFEVNSLLQKALKLQGFDLVGDNFLKSQPKPIYDRVVANPPFANNGVARHTTHAFKFLKPGGKLVTLAHHYQLKPSDRDKAFFAWLARNNARFLNCDRAFADAERQTNVPLQIIVIDKDKQ